MLEEDELKSEPITSLNHRSHTSQHETKEGELEGNSCKVSYSAVSVRRAYFNVALVGGIGIFCNFGYYSLAGTLTSLHELLGFVSLGLQWFSWIIGNLLCPAVIDLIGLKLVILAGSIGYLSFTLCCFYPSWYTFVPGSILLGLGFGFIYTGSPNYLNQSARVIGQNKSGDVEKNTYKYVSYFQSILIFSFRLGAASGNAVSSAFFLTDAVFLNSTSFAVNGTECIQPTTLGTITSATYYQVIGTATGVGLVAVVLSIFLPNDANLSLKSKKKVLKDLKNRLISMLRLFLKWQYVFPLLGGILSGFDTGFYYGLFSKYFITECIGIGYVGLAITVWSVTGFTVSISVGRFTPYTTRTAAAILLTCVHLSAYLFLIFWERQPNVIVVFVAAIVSGLVSTFWNVIPLIYFGIVGSKDKLATEAFGLFWAFVAFGGALNYFISSSIPVSANLWMLVGLAVVTLIAYLLAEAFHGEKLCTRKSPCPQKGEYSLRDHAATLYASSSQIF